MKKLIVIFIFALMFLSAQGETYSAPGDIYYHQHEACALGSGLTATDSTEGLFPCPVCADDPATHEEPEAFILGDTVILRMPDQWMRERPNIGTVFAAYDKNVYSGNEAAKLVSEMLHGADYRAFLDREDAVAYVYSPGIYADDPYCQRHIGDSWYVTSYLPENVPEDVPFVYAPYRDSNTWYGYLRFFGGRMWKRDGLVMYYSPAEWGDLDYSIALKGLADTPVYEAERDGYVYSLYGCDDVFLCVISSIPEEIRAVISDDMDYELTLLIDGLPVCAETVANNDRFCVTLTSGEAYRLQNGSALSLFNGAYSSVDFGESAYAIFNGDYHWWEESHTGVVDKNGNEVLPERYYRISRYGDRFFCTRSEFEPTERDGLYVYDMDAGDENVYEYIEKDAAIYYTCANDAVFVLSWYGNEERLVLCDMLSGEILGSIPKDFGSQENYSDDFIAEYVCAGGQPQRLCLMAENDAYLMDNDVNVIAHFKNCAQLCPLTWHDDKGMFLLIYGEDAYYLPLCGELLKHGFDAGYYTRWYGEDDENDPWFTYEREQEPADIYFGLIDENGRQLTYMDYTYIRVLSDTQIELGKRDGERIVVAIES